MKENILPVTVCCALIAAFAYVFHIIDDDNKKSRFNTCIVQSYSACVSNEERDVAKCVESSRDLCNPTKE